MTHINAYYADVQEKLVAVQRAQGEYEAAKQRLEDKEREEGIVADAAPSPESPAESEPEHETNTQSEPEPKSKKYR